VRTGSFPKVVRPSQSFVILQQGIPQRLSYALENIKQPWEVATPEP
jgi:hypothetical protein